MHQKKTIFLFVLAGLILVFGSGLWLATAQPVEAQCGSQASSCKNCHEVQAKDPVNNDGKPWHQSHAFGDFCYICHAGNQQATDETTAHTGMVDPLSDIKASCQQCHPSDLQARAQVYATALGVDLSAGGSTSSTATSPTTSAPAAGQAPSSGGSAGGVVAAPPAPAVDANDPNLVDYVKRYDEMVLGKNASNLGNTILLVLIVLLALGGGGLVILHEKLVKVSFGDTKTVAGEYPAEVVNMLPAIAGLKPASRKSLKNVLANPKKAAKVLGLMDAVVSDDEKNTEDAGSENGKE